MVLVLPNGSCLLPLLCLDQERLHVLVISMHRAHNGYLSCLVLTAGLDSSVVSLFQSIVCIYAVSNFTCVIDRKFSASVRHVAPSAASGNVGVV